MASEPSFDDSSFCSPTQAVEKRGYTCDICGANLSRPAHLERHRARHSTAATKSFLCRLCGKSFSRKDVYQRHKRSVHDADPSSRPNRRKKSCRRCIRYKLRCSRELPCIACRDRPDQCVYDLNAAAPTGRRAGDHSVSDDANRGPNGPSANLNDLVDAANLVRETTAATPTQALHCSSFASGDQFDEQRGPRIHMLDVSPGSPTVASTVPTGCEAESSSFPLASSPRMLRNEAAEAYPLSPSYTQDPGSARPSRSLDSLNGLLQRHPGRTTPSGPEERDVGLPVADFQIDSLPFDLYGWDTLLGYETEPSEGISPGMSLGMTSHHAAEQPPADEVAAYPEETAPPMGAVGEAGNATASDQRPGRRSPHDKPPDNVESWPGVLDRGGNETWPFDYTSNKGFRRITLPPLKDVLEQTVGSRPHIQRNILGDLIKVLSAPQIPSLNDTPALEAMPAVAFLSEFTRVYFAEFHNVSPVIHIPTWRIEKCPTALLAAIACIGATYSTAEGSSEVSALLAEITQRALFWMGQQDSSAFRNKEYITASCFHQIYALGSGNRRLYEIADASRGLLVTSLRGLGVLSSESTSSTADPLRLDPKQLKAMTGPELEAAWLAWRDREMEKRMAWSVFEFDCTLSTMTSKRAAFRIAELPARLPCAESIWEAHSARAWAALVPFAASPPVGLLFYPTLRQVIARGTVPNDAPAWAKRLCAHAIGRILHDMKEVQDASAPNILGLPSMTDAHEQTREGLLASLGALEGSLATPMCTADVVNMNVLSLAFHRAHLSSAGHEVMDLVINIFRNSGQGSNHLYVRSVEAAKDRLRHIFREQPVRTRRLVFHSGVIIAIARDCTINTPCETLSVFMGYALMLVYIKLSPFQEQDAAGQLPGGACKLDEIPWTNRLEAALKVEQWIETGGPASLGPIANICDSKSFQAAKKVALDALAKLSVWGLARKFRQTVGKFG